HLPASGGGHPRSRWPRSPDHVPLPRGPHRETLPPRRGVAHRAEQEGPPPEQGGDRAQPESTGGEAPSGGEDRSGGGRMSAAPQKVARRPAPARKPAPQRRPTPGPNRTGVSRRGVGKGLASGERRRSAPRQRKGTIAFG